MSRTITSPLSQTISGTSTLTKAFTPTATMTKYDPPVEFLSWPPSTAAAVKAYEPFAVLIRRTDNFGASLNHTEKRDDWLDLTAHAHKSRVLTLSIHAGPEYGVIVSGKQCTTWIYPQRMLRCMMMLSQPGNYQLAAYVNYERYDGVMGGVVVVHEAEPTTFEFAGIPVALHAQAPFQFSVDLVNAYGYKAMTTNMALELSLGSNHSQTDLV
eukprot:gene14257-584_t